MNSTSDARGPPRDLFQFPFGWSKTARYLTSPGGQCQDRKTSLDEEETLLIGRLLPTYNVRKK
jgi:hypothetical protein